jgi:hypothetical protein
MATKLLNFRVEAEIADAVEREAKSIPYRTVSEYLREMVERELKRVARAKKSEAEAR